MTVITAEVAVRAAAARGLIRIATYPTTHPTQHILGDIDRDFGVWHYPYRVASHHSPCFDVQFSTNSYGARDRERSLHSNGKRRVVVLGDSFVEGFGVPVSQRMTDVAESNTGVELLNFGVSGNFGSVQEWLLYEKLASKFEHTELMIFHLPANDFKDNDPRIWPTTRYRPYLRERPGGGFEVFYPVAFENRETPQPISRSKYYRRTLYNNIYLLNLFRQFCQLFDQRDLNGEAEDLPIESNMAPYNDFTDGDLDRLLFSYKRIIETAAGRPVTIFVIPTRADLESFDTAGYKFRVVEALNKFSKQWNNVRIVDLLPEFANYAKKYQHSYGDFTLGCDDHWNELGNNVAAKAVAAALERT